MPLTSVRSCSSPVNQFLGSINQSTFTFPTLTFLFFFFPLLNQRSIHPYLETDRQPMQGPNQISGPLEMLIQLSRSPNPFFKRNVHQRVDQLLRNSRSLAERCRHLLGRPLPRMNLLQQRHTVFNIGDGQILRTQQSTTRKYPLHISWFVRENRFWQSPFRWNFLRQLLLRTLQFQVDQSSDEKYCNGSAVKGIMFGGIQILLTLAISSHLAIFVVGAFEIEISKQVFLFTTTSHVSTKLIHLGVVFISERRGCGPCRYPSTR